MIGRSLTPVAIIAGLALGSATVGLLGTYYALPDPSAEMASEASGGQVPTSPDSLATKTLGRDSTTQKASMSREEGSNTAKSDAPSETEQLRILRDSIDTLHRRLRATRDTTDTLRTQLADIEADQAKVNELSSALMDMRRRKLGNLLEDVDMSVLRRLYKETSGRARTRLLQALAPTQAAQFVNQVVEEGDESASAPDADSMATTG
jgi:septal ring factor EnvC (AmiA/AmiB activator)